MSAAHEALVRESQQIIASEFARFHREGPAANIEDTWQQRSARRILARVYLRLETVTPKMTKAWIDLGDCYDKSDDELLVIQWLAMLRVSALNP